MKNDRLSFLPESLAHHILSFLDMKDVIRIRILSRWWRYISTSIPYLNFKCDPEKYCRRDHDDYVADFVKFVERGLLINSAPNIQRFRLSFNYLEMYANRVDALIDFSMRKGIQELDLDFNRYLRNPAPYQLPSWLLGCETLISLKLENCRLGVYNFIMFPKLTSLSLQCKEITDSFIFPKLTTLSLHCGKIREGLIEDLLKGCPLLEDLVMTVNSDCTSMKICSSSSSSLRLKRLTMCLTNEVAHENLRIDVQAPNLEILSIYSKRLGKYYFKDMLSMREAYISVWRPQGGRSGAIECIYSLETSLQNLCHVRVLKLSTVCIQALSLRALQNLPPLIFKHKHLILETGPTKWELPGIVYLLKNSPDVETLSVKIEESNIWYDLSTVLGEEIDFDETEYWESFISAFSYVVHDLKTIKIWDAASKLYLALRSTSEASLRYEENEVRFLKFILKSAIRLEKLTYITKPNFKGIHDIAQMIGALPRASSSAEVLICL